MVTGTLALRKVSHTRTTLDVDIETFSDCKIPSVPWDCAKSTQ